MATAAEPIFHMAYISRASEELGYKDIEEILTSAQIRNPAQGITAVLIHNDGNFLQLLEGPSEKVVKQTLSRIILDERHNNLRVIAEWHSADRLFGKMPIGFCDSDLHLKHTCFSFLKNLFSDSATLTHFKSEELIQFFIGFANSDISILTR